MNNKKNISKIKYNFFKIILQFKNVKEIENFFAVIFTKHEIKELKNRWQVILMLSGGYTYKKIEKKTGASSATIARIKSVMKTEKLHQFK